MWKMLGPTISAIAEVQTESPDWPITMEPIVKHRITQNRLRNSVL